MRYTTEFQIIPESTARTNELDFNKKESSCKLGVRIGELIGFDKLDKDTFTGNDRYKLEAEVFSRNQWREFKQSVATHIKNSFDKSRADYELVQFKSLFEELENSKPILNQLVNK